MKYIGTAIVTYVLYLILTIGTGNQLLWSTPELIIGAVFALVLAVLLHRAFPKAAYFFKPARWFYSLVYLFPFFWALTIANIDVAYRVVTGRINPGIVRISPRLKTDAATSLLATSITLTPGTLTVDVDEKNNDLYVHWINVDEDALPKLPAEYRPVCNGFPDWARRIAD